MGKLHTLVNANVERKVMLNDATAKPRELLESGRSIDTSDYSVKTLKLARRYNDHYV